VTSLGALGVGLGLGPTLGDLPGRTGVGVGNKIVGGKVGGKTLGDEGGGTDTLAGGVWASLIAGKILLKTSIKAIITKPILSEYFETTGTNSYQGNTAR